MKNFPVEPRLFVAPITMWLSGVVELRGANQAVQLPFLPKRKPFLFAKAYRVILTMRSLLTAGPRQFVLSVAKKNTKVRYPSGRSCCMELNGRTEALKSADYSHQVTLPQPCIIC